MRESRLKIGVFIILVLFITSLLTPVEKDKKVVKTLTVSNKYIDYRKYEKEVLGKKTVILNNKKCKIAYITFDDGPSKKITPKVIKILKDYDVSATFFVIGELAKENSNILKEIYEEGHAIGNHSYTHNFKKIYSSIDFFYEEVKETDKVLKDILGSSFNSRLFRFPGGSFESYKAPYKKMLQEKGYEVFDWNAENGDGMKNDLPKEKLINTIKESTKGKREVVILMHDSATKKTTIEALPFILEYLKQQGYIFKTLN